MATGRLSMTTSSRLVVGEDFFGGPSSGWCGGWWAWLAIREGKWLEKIAGKIIGLLGSPRRTSLSYEVA